MKTTARSLSNFICSCRVLHATNPGAGNAHAGVCFWGKSKDHSMRRNVIRDVEPQRRTLLISRFFTRDPTPLSGSQVGRIYSPLALFICFSYHSLANGTSIGDNHYFQVFGNENTVFSHSKVGYGRTVMTALILSRGESVVLPP